MNVSPVEFSSSWAKRRARAGRRRERRSKKNAPMRWLGRGRGTLARRRDLAARPLPMGRAEEMLRDDAPGPDGRAANCCWLGANGPPGLNDTEKPRETNILSKMLRGQFRVSGRRCGGRKKQ